MYVLYVITGKVYCSIMKPEHAARKKLWVKKVSGVIVFIFVLRPSSNTAVTTVAAIRMLESIFLGKVEGGVVVWGEGVQGPSAYAVRIRIKLVCEPNMCVWCRS